MAKKSASSNGDTGPDKPKRYGGAWRAFCHEKSKNRQFSAASLQDLAIEYRELSPREREKYEEMGKQATLINRAGLPAYPGHSVTARNRRRKLWRQPCEKDERAAVPPSLLAKTKAFEEQTLQGHGRVSLLEGNVEYHAKMLRKMWREGKRVDREQKQHQQMAVDLQNSSLKEECLANRQLLQQMPCRWQATPLSMNCPALAASFMPECLQCAPQITDKTYQELLEEWKQKHGTLPKSKWQGPEVPITKTSMCASVGCCRCGLHGKGLNRIKTTLSQHLRRLTIEHGKMKDVEQSKLLIQWTALKGGPRIPSGTGLSESVSLSNKEVRPGVASAASHKTNSSSSSSDGIGDNSSADDDDQHYWTLVVAYLKKPWRTTLAEFKVIPEDVARLQRLSLNEDAGVGSFRFAPTVTREGHITIWNMWDWLTALDQRRSWRLQFWWASAKESATAYINYLHASPAEFGQLHLWDAEQRQAQRRRRVPLHERLQLQEWEDGGREFEVMGEEQRRRGDDEAVQDAVPDSDAEDSAGGNFLEEENEAAVEGDSQSEEVDQSMLDRVVLMLRERFANIDGHHAQNPSSSSSSNSSSSSRSSSSDRAPRDARANDVAEVEAPPPPEAVPGAVRIRHPLGLAHWWGVFRIIPVRRGGEEQSGWQLTCTNPNHPATQAGTACTRAMTWQTPADSDRCLQTLKHWAIQGLDLATREAHKRLPHRPSVDSLPSMETLDAAVPHAWPV